MIAMAGKTNYELAKESADKTDREIIEVLKSGKSFLVEAGAGSGKTYSLHKVVEWIDNNKAKEYKKSGKYVACITYTNAAVDVIASRISQGSSITPSTIHNFAWENICIFHSTLINATKELELIPDNHAVDEVKQVECDPVFELFYRKWGRFVLKKLGE